MKKSDSSKEIDLKSYGSKSIKHLTKMTTLYLEMMMTFTQKMPFKSTIHLAELIVIEMGRDKEDCSSATTT